MAIACDEHSDDENEITQDAELAELAAPEYLQERQLRQREEAKSKSNNVTGMGHTTVPGIASVQLGGWCNVQEKVPQRRLKRVEGKVQ